MVMMKNVAIFGCGTAGRRAWTHLRSKYKIVTFLDNDKQKQGSKVGGIPVADPVTYDYSRLDHVFIASMYLDEILVQLLAQGVPSTKIEYVSLEILSRESPKVGAAALGSDSFGLLRKALCVPFRLLR
jgi:FlaA1/EpsC-like NDP-sugar epimerase